MSNTKDKQAESDSDKNGQNSDTDSPLAGREEYDRDLIRYQKWLRELFSNLKTGNT